MTYGRVWVWYSTTNGTLGCKLCFSRCYAWPVFYRFTISTVYDMWCFRIYGGNPHNTYVGLGLTTYSGNMSSLWAWNLGFGIYVVLRWAARAGSGQLSQLSCLEPTTTSSASWLNLEPGIHASFLVMEASSVKCRNIEVKIMVCDGNK